MGLAVRYGLLFLFGATVLYLTFFRSRSTPAEAWLAESAEPSPAGRAAFLGGLALTVLFFAVLQWFDPFYFSQDDNLSSFLPVILHGCRSLFAGVFPSWNAYQHLGAPTTSIGLYSLTYPPTVLSYAIARYVLGNENLTLEVLATFHVVGAYVACFCLARRLGLGSVLAMTFSFCSAFSGYQLIAGRSWYYMLPVGLWFPLLLLQAHRLKAAIVPRSWALQTALILGLWFHAGNAQMWTYGLLFLTLLGGLWFWAGELARERLIRALGALLMGTGLALPLALAQLREARHRVADPWGHLDIGAHFSQLFFPYVPDGALRNSTWSGMYFSGGVLPWASLAALLVAIALVARGGGSRKIIGGQAFTWLAVLAIWLGLGDSGHLWIALSWLPIFSKFALPFKFLAFVQFFAGLSGALFLQNLWRRQRWSPRFLRTLATIAVVTTGWNAWSSSHVAFFYFSDKPYPLLPAEYAQRFLPGVEPIGRIYPRSAPRSNRQDFILNLPLNFPTAYAIPSFLGYDTTVHSSEEFKRALDRTADDPKALAEYGVRWIVAETDLPPGLGVLRPTLVFTWKGISTYELASPRPLVFNSDGAPVRFAIRGDGLDLFPDGAGLVTANFLHRHWMKAYDEKGVRLPIETDSYDRITVRPPGTRKVAIRYEPPWLTYLAAGLAVFLLGLCLESGVVVFIGHRRARAK